MLKSIARGALWLDTWLEARLGRPYHALLSAGLIMEVIRKIGEIPHKLRFTENLLWDLFEIFFELALLVHQVGALSHRFKARDERDHGD